MRWRPDWPVRHQVARVSSILTPFSGRTPRGERLAKEAAEDEQDAAVLERNIAVQERDAALTANADYQEPIRQLQAQLREGERSAE